MRLSLKAMRRFHRLTQDLLFFTLLRRNPGLEVTSATLCKLYVQPLAWSVTARLIGETARFGRFDPALLAQAHASALLLQQKHGLRLPVATG